MRKILSTFYVKSWIIYNREEFERKMNDANTFLRNNKWFRVQVFSFHSFSLFYTESIPFFSFQSCSFKIDNIYRITHENQDS